MDVTSVSLLDRLRGSDDAAAWQRLVDIYQPWLRAWLCAHVLQPADVDDLVQDVLTILLRELPAFQHNGRTGAFRAWLRGMLLNRLRQFRRQSVSVVEGADSYLDQLANETSELTQQWDREHDQNVVSRLLQLISTDFDSRTWWAFRAFVIDGRPAADVAAELDMSPGAVWSAKSHVLKRLREEAKGILD